MGLAPDRLRTKGKLISMNERKLFVESVRRFLKWLDANGTAGYDPYDLWATGYGKRTRRLYYRSQKFGVVAAAPLITANSLFPAAVRRSINPKKYATSHSHLILGLAALYQLGFGDQNLERAVALGEELDQLKINGYSGACWGYPFDWVNRRGLWPKDTPLITVTPYGFEAVLALFEATNQETYRERARSVLAFALNDLNNTESAEGSIASSYSPLDKSLIINASAYRAFVLARGHHLFGDERADDLARKLTQFVINSQNSDGSWPYALEAAGDDFVDHFHTCFVLKNLAKIYDVVADDRIKRSIEKGFEYYEKSLFYNNGLPRPFSSGGSRLLKYNLYDFAEAINLGVILRDIVPRSLDRSIELAEKTVRQFQLADGHFVTSVDRFGIKNKLAFIRWPQAQMFHSLTSLIKALD
jgi:uncharacterized protein YyaL (SSP411 family)